MCAEDFGDLLGLEHGAYQRVRMAVENAWNPDGVQRQLPAIASFFDPKIAHMSKLLIALKKVFETNVEAGANLAQLVTRLADRRAYVPDVLKKDPMKSTTEI